MYSQESYVVNSKSINVREVPSPKAKILEIIANGEVVSVLNSDNPKWWLISYYGNKGYVSPKLLLPLEESNQYKDWHKEYANTGDKPACENISPQYDYNLKNRLLIHVGNNADVVIKLMDYSDNCIRIAYIKSGDDYCMRNIPEGYYYLKIAYGKDLRKYSENGQCIVKFMRDAIYKKGLGKLDFYKIKKPNTIDGNYEYQNWELPSYELTLNTEYNKGNFHNFHSTKISEFDFNK
jgi:uncharacterized protein YgiM (DUF1202 family)